MRPHEWRRSTEAEVRHAVRNTYSPGQVTDGDGKVVREFAGPKGHPWEQPGWRTCARCGTTRKGPGDTARSCDEEVVRKVLES